MIEERRRVIVSFLFVLLFVLPLAFKLTFEKTLDVIHGHGRLMDPPSRNAMWRFGYPNPVNYNDNELFCGGYAGSSSEVTINPL